jgi:putative Ca2+/H+ antiporter (TMEM165/GDT1 family)
MDWKLLFTVLSTIFVAEIGDKTQLATLLYASGAEVSKLTVFLGAALALILTSALGVFVGSVLSHSINPKYLA